MYIGIDLGTSSLKAVLVNEGKIIRTESNTYEPDIPKPTWSEQDPEVWYHAMVDVLTRLVKGYEKDIESIGISGQMHGLVILDENDQVIRKAMLWNDQRTFGEVDFLNSIVTKEKLLKETGNIAVTGLTLPKLLWLKENETQNFNRINKIMLPKDYLVYKLTGKFVSEMSDLSGSLFYDLKKHSYSKDLLTIAHINEDQLPTILKSYEVAGTILNNIKETIGFIKDVKVIAGGGDQAMAAVGANVIKNGDLNISLGTSGVVLAVTDEPKIDYQTYLHAFSHVNDKYILMGVTLSAAGALGWWKKNFYQDMSYDDIFNDIIHAPIEDTVYFLPYLSGERNPINDPFAKATFVGMSLNHKKMHLSRALIEGVTFSLKSCYDRIKDLEIDIKRIRVTGGGSKNEIWCQMIADIFNAEVEIPDNPESGAFGAAITAMIGLNVYKSFDEACEKLIPTHKKYTPNKDNVELYHKKYINYLELYPALKEYFQII
ncbi:Xylulose kinase [Acholeplasma oculi]|uniref:Xylulose kinase n=1 Tax=Acholeplasma oculi TaxID=35623 RepID=A0A061AFE3_9MOLU|nr:xylulokinase [Acholeplasma oculi]CDR30226.1 Xylulose kinase [Acholeplasma oculi]SKC43742.1 xylulokinase [Acholeplasma oculi]SUT88614.1 Xylulose kinase [Acholeplasma oculi]